MPAAKKKVMFCNMKFMLILCCLFQFYSCVTENEDITSSQESTEHTFKFDMERTIFDNTEGDVKISAFLFYNGVLYKSHQDLALDQSGRVTLSIVANSQIYFIANNPTALEGLEEGKTTLKAFLIKSTPSLSEEQKPHPHLFFSGSLSTDRAGTYPISLKRSVARIDLDTSRDTLTKITRIIFEDIPLQSRYFESTSPIVGTKYSYEANYATELSGIHENLLQLYESGPVKIIAYGTYNGLPIQVVMELPEVKRSKIYSIKILNAGGEITSSFDILPWETGETVEGGPNATEKISISQSLSNIPQDIEVIYSENKINISQDGGEMTLAFLANSQIELANTDGVTSDIMLTSLPSEVTSGGIVSRIKVQVATQGKGRLPYFVTLNLKSTLQSFSYDHISIHVDGSKYPIEEVTMGGVTWMAFNARSRDLEDQVYPLDGATVEETYEKHWLNTVGGLFQWGRIFMHIPWQSYGHNTGGQTQNNPWESDTHVPCPEGYRLPTQGEIRALLPLGQILPGTYDYNGEAVEATLHTASQGFTTPTGVTGTPRYLKLTSLRTGNQLFFPLSGEKGDKSSSNNPGFGKGFTLWAPANNGATGGWAWVGKFWPDSGNSYTIPTAPQQLQAEGYAYVRCLKK